MSWPSGNYVNHNVSEFLLVSTPPAWVEAATENVEILLIDHANCERKAASSALSMTYKFINCRETCLQLSQIAREEMRHYEQVLELIDRCGYRFGAIGPSRYAKHLHSVANEIGGNAAIDELLIAAIIEARSCERFNLLAQILEPHISGLYKRLFESESRHFRFYLGKAHQKESQLFVTSRLNKLLQEEATLISTHDSEFRFHSGVPRSRCSTDLGSTFKI